MTITCYPTSPDRRHQQASRQQQRIQLLNRIEHARHAAEMWPSSNRTCELFHLQRELERLDARARRELYT